MKYLLLLSFLGTSFAFGQNCGCDFTFNSSTTTIDGNNYSFQPGDTICISGGNRGRLRLKNVSGTSVDPITVINCGGQVNIDPDTYSYGFKLQNCDNVHITGTGDTAVENGFIIEDASGYAMPIESLSNHLEIDHIQFENSGNYAVYYKNNPTCDLTANKGNFTMEDCSIHNLKINNCSKGIRIGHIDYDIGVNETCGTLYPHGAEGLKIYKNIISNTTSGDGIRIYGAECHVFDNVLTDISGRGITIGTHCEAIVESNLIGNSEDEGLRCLGSGKYEIYNNLLYNNGDASHEAVELAFDNPNGDILGNQLLFFNNTVVSSSNFNFSIIEPSNATDTCKIQNNIFCNPGFTGSSSSYFDPYLNIDDTTMIKLHNNVSKPTLADLKFKDVINNDYGLTHESPAVNAGSGSLDSYDYADNPRSLAGEVDAGAIEYIPERLDYLEQIPLQGLYVNDFKNVIGDAAEEEVLLTYAENNGFNYLVLYNLNYINNNLYDLTDPAEAIALANFIEDAKTNYGIVQVAAVGEKDASFDKIEDYNDLYDGNWFKQIDVLNLEFEFWANTSGSTFDYYCTSYLQPNGFPCTTQGAYDFYLEQLELIDQRAIDMEVLSEIYIGTPNDSMSTELAENCDRILLHFYRTSDTYNNGNSIYNYNVSRIRAIAQSTRMPAVMPIFSAMSYHMGPWLETHTIYEPMDTWLHGQNSYDDDTTYGVQDLKIAGHQWYRYTELLVLNETEGNRSHFQPVDEGNGPNDKATPAAENLADKSIRIYPSVFDTELSLTIDVAAHENVYCVIYNSQGKIVLNEQLISSSNQLNVGHLKSGIYYLKILDNGKEVHTEKLIKVNL